MNSRGSAFIKIMVLMGLVNGAAIYNYNRNKSRLTFDLKAIQLKVIDNTLREIHSTLADAQTCNTARGSSTLPANQFQTIGRFSPNYQLDSKVTLLSINLVDPDTTDREYRLDITFRKYLKEGGAYIDQVEPVKIQDFTDQNGVTLCTSFETQSIGNSRQTICESTGGSINSDGTCTYSTIANNTFAGVLMARACQLIGGSLVSGYCNGINISGTSGTIQTNQLKTDSITLTGQRTNFLNTSCGSNEVAYGVNTDSTLKCRTLVCTAPTDATSSYSPSQISTTSIQCQCLRNNTRESGVSCFSTDYGRCNDRYENDGCGGGMDSTCVIYGRRPSDCSCAESTCSGSTCYDANCGRPCEGTMNCQPPAAGGGGNVDCVVNGQYVCGDAGADPGVGGAVVQ